MSRRNSSIDAMQGAAPTARYLRSARLCRSRDLQQLAVLCELVQGTSELIHALQKERGAASIYLGSGGTQFADRLALYVADSRRLEESVRGRLEHVEERLEPMSCSARFYLRVAYAFQALDSLPDARDRVAAVSFWAPQDAAKAFTEVIARLLAVGFAAADIAADPETSRMLVALVNFAQGKEYAGQERAAVGAALSRGRFDAVDIRHLEQLHSAQARAFKIFTDFADPRHAVAFLDLSGGAAAAEYRRMRTNGLPLVTADAWYEAATRRIDAMRRVEEGLSVDLGSLCVARLAAAADEARIVDRIEAEAFRATAPLAMLVADVDPALNRVGMAGGVELCAMRSILDVVEAQARRIDDISSQLDAARIALSERKTIERAKGLLMQSRRLSEKDAYALLRQTAMSQNRRMVEVAQAIIGNAGMFAA